MKTGVSLAFDSNSVRTFDRDGSMHVSRTPITKANVCRYQGKEIPDYEQLGLDPNKWYRLYRDPEELQKAADTFNNKPVLNRHEGFTPLAPPKELIVGMTGDDAEFDYPYLYQSMTINDSKMTAGIESNQHREISSSYYWRCDMTPGTSPEGEEYDGVMRDLSCNHVAIVPDGRAGSDVLVHDSKPTGYNVMSKISQIMRALKGKLASDADPEDLREELGNIVEDEDQTQADRDNESEAERLREREERERKYREKDERADDDSMDDKMESDKEKIARLEAELKAAKEKPAEDAGDDSTEKAVQMACDAMRSEFKSLQEAQNICRPFVGNLACDSAEELYRATLKEKGINTKGVHASALKPMVQMLGNQKLANDAAPVTASRSDYDDVLAMVRGGKK